LASGKDALYNAAGLPIRQDRTGRAGNQVGQELDFLVNFHLDNHSDILLSYSYLFARPFIMRTATTPSGRDNPQARYVQSTYRWCAARGAGAMPAPRLLSFLDVPQLPRAGGARRPPRLAVGAEGDAGALLLVPREGLDELARGQVPDFRRPVAPAGDD